ncbi:MAG: hypothetical protein HY319_27320 [Armatimonadetes bacterium]|nr:hypothetical protein [Armatimonadota bacterium]
MADAGTRLKVTPDMTPQEMKAYFIEQTRRSLSEWEKQNRDIHGHPPFALDQPGESRFRITPEQARQIGLRKQVEEFAAEAEVSTAGVRENQNVICPWDHRYRINEYIFALIAEALSRLARELQGERLARLPSFSADEVAEVLGPESTAVAEEIFDRPLREIIPFVKANPVRIVGGEVRSNTPCYVALMARIYAANGLYVLLTEDRSHRDTSSIFMWSYMCFVLGLSGGDYFTSSHGSPQKQSDKILAPDGAQFLPPLYARIVAHMFDILEQIEKDGYDIRLAAQDDPHLLYRLAYGRMAKLYAAYLRKGPAGPKALELIRRAIGEGLRLKLDFFGGAGYKTIRSIFEELGIVGVFEGGFIRTEEDPFFHNIGFRVARKKGSEEYEVVHDSVDASLPAVVATAGYDKLLAGDPVGQVIFNVDPDADRFVAGQVVPESENDRLDRWGISRIALGDGRTFALYSPNQLFLALAENDRVVAVEDGTWDKASNFDIHTYVSALSWDEWADYHGIPVVRVPVGFKEIAAVERQVEKAMAAAPGQPILVENELGERIEIGPHPKLHHAGEESGGKIGGPGEAIYNVLGEHVIAMREKSSGEACLSAVSLMARLHVESRPSGKPEQLYLHRYLERIFESSGIRHPMEFRGDIVHYNEAIFDPAELARAKKDGIADRVRYNAFFHGIADGIGKGRISLDQGRELLEEALPAMTEDWARLEAIDVWSDGLQFWFREGGKVRDICLRPSGTDAKTKVYFDGTDKHYLIELFAGNFKDFSARPSETYRRMLG